MNALLAYILKGDGGASHRAAIEASAVAELGLIDALLRCVPDPALIFALTSAKGEVARISEALETADDSDAFFLSSALSVLSCTVHRISLDFISAGIDRMKG